jgi:hypothetical protein
MKFTIEILAALFLFTDPIANAQQRPPPPTPPPVTVVTEFKLLCRVEEFTEKKCKQLIDTDDQPIRGAEACKEHGVEKGRECLKISGAAKVKVKVKMTEVLGANRNYNRWTCELDKQGGFHCP